MSKKLFLRDSKLWVGEFPEVPPVSSSANQDAARMRSYDREFEYAKKIAIEVVNDKEVTRIIIEQDEQPTFWKECLLSDQLYDVPSGWTVEYFCKTMNPKFCSRCVKGVCPDWRACLIPSENAQGESGTVATGTPEAEQEFIVSTPGMESGEQEELIELLRCAAEALDLEGGNEQMVSELRRYLNAHHNLIPPHSQASEKIIDDTDLIEQDLHIYGIAYEMREGKSVIRIDPRNIRVRRKGPSQAESESQTDLWNYLGNKINRHMKPLDDDFGIHPLLDLYGKSEFTITRKMKL